MVTFKKRDDQPTFHHSLDSEDQVRVIDVKQDPDISELKPKCLICNSNQMREVDTFIQCQRCGNVVDLSKGDIIQDESDLDLTSGKDPYAETNKPYIRSFSSDGGYSDYEFRHEHENKVYRGSAQTAMMEESKEFEQQQKDISRELRQKRSEKSPFD